MDPSHGEKLTPRERDLITECLRLDSISADTIYPYRTNRPLMAVGEWLDMGGRDAQCIRVFSTEIGFEIRVYYTEEAEWVQVVSL